MLYIFFALVLLLPSIRGLITLKQSPDAGRTVTSRQIVSESVTGSQTQGTLQLQNPTFTAVQDPNHFFQAFAEPAAVLVPTPTAAQSSRSIVTSSLTNDATVGSIRTSVRIDGETTMPNVHSQYVQSVQALAETSSITLRPSSSIRGMSRLNHQTPKGKLAFTYGTSTSVPLPAISATIVLTSGRETITKKSESRYIFPSSQTLGSGSSSAVFGLQASSGRTALITAQSISMLGAESLVLPVLVINSQTVTADTKNRYILVDGQTLTPGSSTTLSPGTPTTILALQTSGTQTSLRSNPSSSLPSYATAAPELLKIPLALSVSGNTMTANNLGQYNNDGQTLTPAGAVTVYDTATPLPPGGSDIVVGTGTRAPDGSITAGFGSGPNVTGVQVFKGGGLGGRDNLWSSSIVVLVGIAVSMWL